MKLPTRMRPEQIREISLLILIVAVVIVFGSLITNYYSGRTFNRIASSVSIIAVVAVGQTIVILTRNIDLSVGSVVGFTAFFTGTVLAAHPALPPPVAVLVAVVVGAVMGAANGVLVAYGRVPSIIVTLGTLAIYRGLLIQYSGAQSVTTASLPAWLTTLPQKTLFTVAGLEIKVTVAMALAVVLIFHWGLTHVRVARWTYVVGSNPAAASLAGLPVPRVLFTAFVLSGALAGFGGFLTLARFGNITVEAGRGLELEVIAAAVVGAVNIFGGSGTVVGAALGAVLIGTLEQSLLRLQINQFWLDAVLGLLILLSVASDAALLRRLRRTQKR